MSEEELLLKLDREWNEAYPRLDVAALDRIIADDWVCIDGAGLIIMKRDLLDRVSSSASFLDAHEFDEISLRIFGDAAIVTGRLSGRRQASGCMVHLQQRYTRVYVKRSNCWQAVATQVTVVE